MYLATLVDLCTRDIVGWPVSKRCDTFLALETHRRAVARHHRPAGLMHHTGRGATCTADAYQEQLRNHQMVSRMSRKGNCWDNAVAESTIGTIKAALWGEHVPTDILEVEPELFAYIEGCYDRKRRHSEQDDRTPMEHQPWVEARGTGAA